MYEQVGQQSLQPPIVVGGTPALTQYQFDLLIVAAIASLTQSLIPLWVAGTYLAGFMVYENSTPIYYYVCNIDGTTTEPAADFYVYNPAVIYNPGGKGWTRYSNLSGWVQFINRNSFGPG